MALLPNINVGSAPNDGTGSSLRDAFTIVNQNFQSVSTFFPNSNVANITANITSTGTSTFDYINANVVYSSTFGNAGALYYGNIATAAQPNITSLGTLNTLTVNGAATLNGATITEGTLTANSTLSAASSFIAQADVDFQGQQKVNVYVVTGSYSVGNGDYLIIANTAGDANCTVTLPNADSSIGRELIVVYSDPDGTNSNNTIVSLTVETGAGNIFTSPAIPSQTGFAWNNEYGDNSVRLVSSGLNWFIL